MSGPNGSALWEFDPSDGSTLTSSGNVVSRWNRITGTFLDLTANDGTTPQIGRRTINGLPALEWNGTSYLYSGGVSQANPVTIYIVIQADSPQQTNGQFVSGFSGGSHAIGIAGGVWYINNGGSSVTSAAIVDKAPHVVTAVFNGASSLIRVDGIQVASGDPGSTAYSASLLAFGSDGANGFIGQQGITFGFPSAHTTAQSVAQEQYIAQRWMQPRPIVVRTQQRRMLGSTRVPVTTNQTLSVTSTQTATLTKAVNYARTLSVTSTGTATLTRIVNYLRTLNATSTGTATLTRVLAYIRTLSVTSTGTATMSRIVSKTLSVTSTGLATIQRQINKPLSVVSTGTATIVRTILKPLSVVSTGTASLARVVTYQRALSAVSTGLASLIKTITKTLSVTSSETPAITPTFIPGGGSTTPKTLSVTSTQTPTLSAGAIRAQALSTTSTQTADLQVVFVAGAPPSQGGIRPGQTFIESRDYIREQREKDELERLNQEALALLLLNA